MEIINTFHVHEISVHPSPTDLLTIPFPITLSSHLSTELPYLDFPVNYPPERIRPSPIMVYIDVIHQKYIINDDSHSIIAQGELSHRSLWSEIDLIKTNVETIHNDFGSRGVNLPHHKEISNQISQKITCSPRLLESKECTFKVVMVVYSIESISNYNGRGFQIEDPVDEYERRRNYGMVPSATKSLDMIKRRVKVEEKETCTICLNEFDGVASAMPCKHLFHNKCIIRWLKRSHYCPVCRFELPTV